MCLGHIVFLLSSLLDLMLCVCNDHESCLEKEEKDSKEEKEEKKVKCGKHSCDTRIPVGVRLAGFLVPKNCPASGTDWLAQPSGPLGKEALLPPFPLPPVGLS